MSLDSRISNPTVEKAYTSAFLLDKAKISRILNVMEERFNNVRLKFEPTYSIELLRGNRLKLNNIEDVFKLDNTIRNPIKTLRIEVEDLDSTKRIDLKCSVFLEAPSVSFRDNISLCVRSFDSKLASQTFAALEEQMQRVFLDDWIYQVAKSRVFEFSLLITPFLFAMLATTFIPDQRASNLPSEKLRLLLALANNAKTSEERVDFLFEVTKQEIEQKISSRLNFNLLSFLSIKALFVALPIVIVLGCIFYAALRCYPIGTFLWGDYEMHYNRLVARRNTLWTVVVLSIVLGIITNFFVMGLAGFINMG